MFAQPQDFFDFSQTQPLLVFLFCTTVVPAIRGLIGYQFRRQSSWVRRGTATVAALLDFIGARALFVPAAKALCKSQLAWNGLLLYAGLQYNCSITGWIGGNDFYARHGVDKYWKVVLQSVLAGQCYFPDDNDDIQDTSSSSFSETSKVNDGSDSKIIRSRYQRETRRDTLLKMAKILTCLIVAKLVYFYGEMLFGLPFDDNCRSIADISFTAPNTLSPVELVTWLLSTSTLWTLLRMELIMFHLTFGTFGHSIVPVTVALLFGESVQIMGPYAPLKAYTATSVLEFWRNWSRPVGEMLRYAHFLPMGGRKRPFVATGAVFMANCVMHFEFSNSVCGEYDAIGWLKAFALMGAVAAVEIVLEEYYLSSGAAAVSDTQSAAGSKEGSGLRKGRVVVERPLWYEALNLAAVHISFGLALYFTRRTFGHIVNMDGLNQGYALKLQ